MGINSSFASSLLSPKMRSAGHPELPPGAGSLGSLGVTSPTLSRESMVVTPLHTFLVVLGNEPGLCVCSTTELHPHPFWPLKRDLIAKADLELVNHLPRPKITGMCHFHANFISGFVSREPSPRQPLCPACDSPMVAANQMAFLITHWMHISWCLVCASPGLRVTANFRCQLQWIKGCPDSWRDIIF